MAAKFYRIANNTNNSIIVNGTYIGPNSEAILTDDVITLIDKQYFEKGILINNGVADVENNLLMIDTKTIQFYKKPPAGIPKSHLDDEVKSSLKKADSAISGKVKMEDLDNDVKSAIKTTVNNGRRALGADLKVAVDQYYQKPATGIPLNDLEERVRTSLSRADRALQSGTVKLEDLDSTLQTKIVVGNGVTGTGGTNASNSMLIKEVQLEKSVRDKISSAYDLSTRIADVGLTYDDLAPEIKGIIEKANLQEDSYWRDPVLDAELLPLTDNKDGDVVLVISDGTLRRWNDSTSIWELISGNAINGGGTSDTNTVVPTGSINTTDVLGEFFALNGQTIFKIPRGYPVGSNNAQVMLNGLLCSKDYDYIEVDQFTIQFIQPLVEDDYVVIYLTNSSPNTNVLVETFLIEYNQRQIKLNYAYMTNQSTIRVYLNGMLVDSGDEMDYIEQDSTTILFNFDLLPGDKVLVRFESSYSGELIQNQFAKVQKVYYDLAHQLNLLRDEVRRNQTTN